MPIVARGVSLKRGETTILHAVDLTIEPGGKVFVLGPNGAGKSVLLRVLHGLIVPTTGTVTWGGATERPGSHTMLFQRPVLLRRSAGANICYALRLAAVRGAEMEMRVRHALADVGLPHVSDRPARVLSGGEQQRLALARAWSLEPELIFLDEPTASLDPTSTRAVETIVRSIHARGTTIVMTTHNLAQAKRLADEVVFVHAGRITERTPAALFFSAPRSAEAAAYLEGERL